MTDLTTRRVIILVLAMLITQPFFMNNIYQDDDSSFNTGLYMLQSFEIGTFEFNQMFITMIQN